MLLCPREWTESSVGVSEAPGTQHPARRCVDQSAACSVSERNASRAPRGCLPGRCSGRAAPAPDAWGPAPPGAAVRLCLQVTCSTSSESRSPTGTGSSRASTPSVGRPGGGSSEARAWPSRASPGERRPRLRTALQVCSVPSRGPGGGVVVSTWSPVTRGPFCVRPAGGFLWATAGGPSWKCSGWRPGEQGLAVFLILLAFEAAGGAQSGWWQLRR